MVVAAVDLAQGFGAAGGFVAEDLPGGAGGGVGLHFREAQGEGLDGIVDDEGLGAAGGEGDLGEGLEGVDGLGFGVAHFTDLRVRLASAPAR